MKTGTSQILFPLLISTTLAFGQPGGVSPAGKVKWRFETKDKVISSVAISGNLAIVGSDDNSLYALDKETGRLVWQVRTNGAISSSPAVQATKTFITSKDGFLYAIETRTGRILWKFETGGERQYDLWDYFLSSPVVFGGMVIFGSGDENVYAIDESTGRLMWAFKTDGIVHATPIVFDNAVFVGSFDGLFYAINLDGSLRWKFDTIGESSFPKGEVQYQAAAEDSTVYFSSRDFNVYALSTRTGKGRWVYHEVGSWTMAVTIAGKHLIVGTSDTHRFIALSKTNGRLRWSADTRLNAYGALASEGTLGYAGSSDGHLLQINLNTGNTEFSFQTANSIQNYGTFFDESNNVKLNELLGKYNNDIQKIYEAVFTLGSILSTPAIDSGTLFFGSTDHFVYAVRSPK